MNYLMYMYIVRIVHFNVVDRHRNDFYNYKYMKSDTDADILLSSMPSNSWGLKGKKRKVAAATGCSGSEPWIRQRQQRTWAFGREEGGTDDAAQHKASTPARPLWRVLAMVDSTSCVSSISKALQVASTDQAFPQNHCDKHPTHACE